MRLEWNNKRQLLFKRQEKLANCSFFILNLVMSKGNRNMVRRIFDFYIEGFRSMTLGKTLWILILIKLFIMFFVLKLFFFPNFLNSKFDTDEEKGNYVIEQLTKPK